MGDCCFKPLSFVQFVVQQKLTNTTRTEKGVRMGPFNRQLDIGGWYTGGQKHEVLTCKNQIPRLLLYYGGLPKPKTRPFFSFVSPSSTPPSLS